MKFAVSSGYLVKFTYKIGNFTKVAVQTDTTLTKFYRKNWDHKKH